MHPLDQLPDAVFIVEDRNIKRVNRRGAEMIGRTKDELANAPLASVLASGEPERLWALQAQHEAGWAPPSAFRLRFVCPDGREVSTDVRFERFDDAMVLSVRDMSEARRADRLVARLAEIAARVESSRGADAVLDACESIFLELGWTVAYSAIEQSTTTPLRVLGRADDPVAIYGRSILGQRLDFKHSPIAAEVARTLRPIFLDNLPTLAAGNVKEAVTLDASMRQAHVRRSVWCPIFQRDTLTHVLAVAGPDITEHDSVAIQLFATQIGAASHAAALQAELVHRERLAAMGRMSAVLAHEIRTPIAVIFNALAALRHDDGQRTRELHDIIAEEAARLRAIATDILDFARPGEPRVGRVDLATVVGEAASTALQHPMVPPGVKRPAISIAAGVPEVRADHELLRRALVNLIVNALSHSPPEGTVRIGVTRDGGGVRITVYNDGKPIAPEAARRIFEPFFTTQAQGIGLGLHVVQRAFDSFGGCVMLDDTSSGVQFSAYLQVAEPREKDSHRRRRSHPQRPLV